MKKRIALLVTLALILLPLSGCKSNSGSKAIRFDISGPVENLDPQFATDPTARMILGNLYEGLVRQAPDGEILPAAAKSYTVSGDGLTYTFTLEEKGIWSDEAPVTAGDFVFAFQRMFGSASPYAANYAAIENAQAVLSREMTASRLGVRAQGDYTLIFTLSRPDPGFLEQLCDPAASPCNRLQFDDSKGRYGLETKFVCTNGPFYLYKWDNTKNLTLLPSDSYRQQIRSAGVVLYIGEDGPKRFQDGKTDLAFLSYDQQYELRSDSATVTPIQKTVWCIVFNQNHSTWGNPLLRQGLAHTVDHQLLGGSQPPSFVTTSVLVPDAVQLMGKSYRDYAPKESPLAYDTIEGQRLFELGLSTLGRDQLPSTATIYFPQEAVESLDMGVLQQTWQKYLAAYIKFEIATPGQIESKFRNEDYQLLLMPFTPSSPDIGSMLSMFTTDSSQNKFGYHNVIYDELLDSAALQPTLDAAAQRYARAETMLLSDAVVIPLYFETTYLAVSNKVQGLEVSAFGDRIQFRDVLKQS